MLICGSWFCISARCLWLLPEVRSCQLDSAGALGWAGEVGQQSLPAIYHRFGGTCGLVAQSAPKFSSHGFVFLRGFKSLQLVSTF